MLVQRLKLQRQYVFVPVTGVGAAQCETAKTQVSVTIAPHFKSTKNWGITALVLPRLIDYVPSAQAISRTLSFVDGLCLADPQPEAADRIDIILGTDVYTRIIEEGLLKSSDASTIAQATALWWIVTGHPFAFEEGRGVPSLPVTSLQCLVDLNLSSLLERFLNQEEAEATRPKPLTPEEEECERHFLSTYKRNSKGGYVLRLPVNSNVSQLGDSEHAARCVLLCTEKRLQGQLHRSYTNS